MAGASEPVELVLGDGRRVRGVALGPSAAPPLLAIHGWLDNAASFFPLSRYLTEHRLVVLDLPGHGESDWRPSGCDYHFIDFVADVAECIDCLGCRQLDLLGHSLGAAVASWVTAGLPGRVGRLVLVEGLGPVPGDPSDGPEALARALRQRRKRPRPPRVYAELDAAVAARAKRGELSAESVRLLADRGTEKVESGWRWRHDPRVAMRSPLYLSEPQVEGFLRGIHVPTLLIEGAQGMLPRLRRTESRAACIPDLRRAVVPGGHHLHMDAPAAVGGVIADFLSAGR